MVHAFIDRVTPIILAGGLGTRLRQVVSGLPKVLAPVNGRPFISFLLDQLLSFGFCDVILCTGYKADSIFESIGEKYEGLSIRYSKETEPLGTGGAIRQALALVQSGTVLVMNGDSFVEADLGAYLAWYLENKHEASLLLTYMRDTRRYGLVNVDKNSLVTRFEEKGQGIGPGWINVGVYLLKKSVLECIPSGKFFSLEREFFPDQVNKGLHAYQCQGKFIDIGMPESYAEAEAFFQDVVKKENTIVTPKKES